MIIVSLDRKLRVGSNLSLSIVHHLTVFVCWCQCQLHPKSGSSHYIEKDEAGALWVEGQSEQSSIILYKSINQPINWSENVASEKYVNMPL